MGTASTIAVPHGDAWRGRYCHWDGYPTYNGRILFEIVKRDGLELARKTLTEDHNYWSSLKTDRTEVDYGTLVAGYGTADNNDAPEWIPAVGDKWGSEWVYILADDGLHVGKVSWTDGAVSMLTVVRWNDDSPDWDAIEKMAYTEEEA